MLTNLLSDTINEEKDPDRKLFTIIMIIAVSVLFSILINVLFGNSNDCKKDVKILQDQIEMMQERMNEGTVRDSRIIDSLKDEKYNDRLNFYIEKDKYSKQLDSLIEKLQKIK